MAKDMFVFNPMDWNTPNTYDNNFMSPTENSGIYLLVVPIIKDFIKIVGHKIMYVGSAKNLRVRYEKHEVRRLLRKTNLYVNFYFKESINYREEEKRLIGLIKPKYNTQWL